MYIDGRSLPDGSVVHADICIVGAGAAGITIAREFIGHPFRVALIESGGLTFDPATQELCRGINTGHQYLPLHETRSRYFGGTTDRWGGNCIPLAPLNFEPRSWIPFSGWPITWTQLLPFYRRAHEVIGLGEFDYDPQRLSAQLGKALFPFDPTRVETVFSRYRALRFGKEFRKALKQAGNITTYLHANVLSLERNFVSNVVDRANIGTLQGKRHTVQARYFVLATGGIENARLLLLSNNVQSNGLGNQNDLVGRFFMEHFWYPNSYIIPNDQSTVFDVYGRQHALENGVEARAHLTLPEDVVRREQIPDFRAEIDASRFPAMRSYWSRMAGVLRDKERARECMEHVAAPVVSILANMGWRTERSSKKKILGYRLNNYTEQTPNPESRVTLTDEKDALGLRRINLNWQLSAIDKYGIQRAHELLALEVERSGFGRFLPELSQSEEEILQHAGGGNHHLGTTRMSADAKTGVVDADCLVYGLHNLYVAGSSVFPTGGSANPTLTIVALSLRLADHLKTKLRV